VLHILKRRFCSIPVLIYPVQVQGAAAAPQIARAIRLASARAECDVLILARGGGSLEDLWAFNEEIVARAIYECQIPIVSGVGHEVDFTIADFVADVRAPTPSGAAELVAPDCAEWLRGLSILSRRLTNALGRTVAKRSERFKWLTRRLAQRHPGLELRQRTLRLDELERRLVRATRHHIAVRANELRGAIAHLRQHSPALRVASAKARLAAASRSLETLTRQRLEQRNRKLLSLIAHLRQQSPAARVSAAKGQLAVASRSLESAARLQLERLNRRVATAGGLLDAFSPLKTLQRGYAIVTDQHGHVITASTEVPIGASIRARLARGEIQARVESTRPPDNADSTKDDGPKEP